MILIFMIEKKINYHKPFPLNEMSMTNIRWEIDEILKSGQLSNGIWNKVLEDKIRKLYNVKHVLTTNNCTMGLLICIAYLEKDRYIQVPMFNWWSDLYILKIMRKDIAWIDVDMKTWLPIESYGGASLYLNTFGNIGRSKRENVIYDSSHCLGAKIDHIGLAHVFSLAPSKLITSCEGGLILTNNDKLYEFALEYRNRISRMSEIHALIGCVYLNHLDEILEWKKKVRMYYEKNINGQFQEIPNNSTHNTISFLNYENLQIPEHIEIKRYYEPIWDNGIENNSKKIYENIICLPSYYNCPYKEITESILELNG